MTEAVLYTNVKGQPVTHASYSSRQTFRSCPRQFELTRIEGYSEKVQRAAPLFGKCVEAGVQAYEESGRISGVGVDVFTSHWADVKALPDFKELVFTLTEGDWDRLQRCGVEMQRLYEIRASYLPISTTPKTLFQQVLRKKIFPGTHLDKLENKAILDMLTFPDWDHKRLPKIVHKADCEYQPKDAETYQIDCTCTTYGKGLGRQSYRPLIVDIKTSGMDLDEHMVPLDPQLAEYAWQLRIPDVAFLWFVKHGHGFKRGSRVSLLADAAPYTAGYELLVYCFDDEDPSTGRAWVYLGPPGQLLKDFEAAVKDLKDGKKEKKRTNAELAFYDAHRDVMTRVDVSEITKQRIQFAAARLTEKQMDDCGRSVAQTTVEMVRAHDEQFYPQLPGIRFPNEKCTFCSMRFICLGDSEGRDKNLTKRGEEWLDGVQEDEV